MQHSGFFDLAPDHVHRLIYHPFEETADIINFDTTISKDDLKVVPIVRDIMLLLNLIAELEPTKATAKGNLPQKLVREFCSRAEHKLFGTKPHSEMDVSKLTVLRHILTKCGWMKLRNKKFSQTKKGSKLVDNGFTGDDYLHLLKTYKTHLDWGYFDYYPELSLIQWSMLFSLYMLNQVATEYISESKFSGHFIEAFPAALFDCKPISEFNTPEEELRNALTSRFLGRFCIYFGLLESKRDNSQKQKNGKELYIKTSPLFQKFIVFPKKNEAYLDERVLHFSKGPRWN